MKTRVRLVWCVALALLLVWSAQAMAAGGPKVFLPLVLRNHPPQHIAFVAPLGPADEMGSYDYELHLINADGTGRRYLASYGAQVYTPPAPAWSPDGSTIAFAGGEWADIYVVNSDDLGLTALTSDGRSYWSPVWSPDGSRIAYTSLATGVRNLWVMNADGTGVTQLADSPAARDGHSWSPDGTRIVYTSRGLGGCDDPGEIHVVYLDSLTEANLTDDPSHDYGAVWSPDGSDIAFITNRVNLSSWFAEDIFVMKADGTALRRLTYNSAVHGNLAWSPDGTKIAFSLEVAEGNTEVYVINADGTGQRRLSYAPGCDDHPAWSPDGTKIAFTSARDGGEYPELYLMNADGTRQIRLTYGGGERASWRP